MNNWYEALPGFWIPFTKAWDPQRWPDYTTPGYADVLEQHPDIENLIRFRGTTMPAKREWGAWLGAFTGDKKLSWSERFVGPVADRMYDTARWKYLVPAWRQAITKVIGKLDDVEDQLTTILWIAEWISRKVIPLPKSLMNRADRVRRTLDCSEKVLAGVTLFRSGKSDYADCLKKKSRDLEHAKNQRAGLLAWFKANWGRLLEAAQATGTWFDVGIVLGPIMGWIEEGMWGLAQKTTDNYLIAVDALMPGYREDFNRNAAELGASVSKAWDDTWGSLPSMDLSTIEEQFPGFAAP